MMTEANSLSQVTGEPTFAPHAVATILDEHYGIHGALSPLPSERDQNFRVSVCGEPRYVAKVANAAEDPDVIDLQHHAMTHLSRAGISCPKPVPSADGITTITMDGHLFRVLTWLPGELLARHTERSQPLLHDLGAFLGHLTRAFADFDHPAARRHLQWDVTHATDVLTRYLDDVQKQRRPLVERALRAFETEIAPALETMPHSVIHNDANDHNVLTEGEHISGLIDFGDMVHSLTLNELAVGSAYAGLGHPKPWRVLAAVAEGYDSVQPLADRDRALLPHLVRTRLATSVAISAHQQALAPHNEYLTISEAPAWRALAAFDEELENT